MSVGAGGTAGNAVTPGGAGGASSFGAFVVAPGGLGGAVTMTGGSTPATVAGTLGGSIFSAVGEFTSGGGPGGGAIRLNGTVGIAGQGGSSLMGAGGVSRTTEGPGTQGAGRGGGAGGGMATTTGSFVSGAAGSSGGVIIWLYF